MTNNIDIKKIANKYGTTFKFTSPSDFVDAKFVKELRTNLNYTQLYFAQVLGVTKKTIEKWEQGKNPVKGPAAALLHIIKEQPEVLKLLVSDDTVYVKTVESTFNTANFSLTTHQHTTKNKKETKTLNGELCAA